jgi:hypothetical protein
MDWLTRGEAPAHAGRSHNPEPCGRGVHANQRQRGGHCEELFDFASHVFITCGAPSAFGKRGPVQSTGRAACLRQALLNLMSNTYSTAAVIADCFV